MSKNIAIVTFHNNISEHTIGGVVTGPIHMKDQLANISHQLGYDYKIDIIVSGKCKKSSGYLDQVIFCDNESICDKLNTYDFIIFKSPGLTYEKYDESKDSHNYDYLLENLVVPFTFIVNEERDREIYPYYKEFTTHPYLKFVMFNSEDMHQDFPDFYENCKDYVEFNYWLTSPPLETLINKFKSKPQVIMSTARWGNRKRVLELAEISPEIVKQGIQVKLAGAQQNYFYSRRVLESNPDQWENLGYYTPSELPGILSGCKYHYNFVYLRRKNRNRVMRDRIEISTLEALREGCLPIICSDTSPKWLNEDDGICISSKDFDRLPDILSTITEEEGIRRLSNFYNKINDHFRIKYIDIINNIQSNMKWSSTHE